MKYTKQNIKNFRHQFREKQTGTPKNSSNSASSSAVKFLVKTKVLFYTVHHFAFSGGPAATNIQPTLGLGALGVSHNT